MLLREAVTALRCLGSAGLREAVTGLRCRCLWRRGLVRRLRRHGPLRGRRGRRGLERGRQRRQRGVLRRRRGRPGLGRCGSGRRYGRGVLRLVGRHGGGVLDHGVGRLIGRHLARSLLAGLRVVRALVDGCVVRGLVLRGCDLVGRAVGTIRRRRVVGGLLRLPGRRLPVGRGHRLGGVRSLRGLGGLRRLVRLFGLLGGGPLRHLTLQRGGGEAHGRTALDIAAPEGLGGGSGSGGRSGRRLLRTRRGSLSGGHLDRPGLRHGRRRRGGRRLSRRILSGRRGRRRCSRRRCPVRLEPAPRRKPGNRHGRPVRRRWRLARACARARVVARVLRVPGRRGVVDGELTRQLGGLRVGLVGGKVPSPADLVAIAVHCASWCGRAPLCRSGWGATAVFRSARLSPWGRGGHPRRFFCRCPYHPNRQQGGSGRAARPLTAVPYVTHCPQVNPGRHSVRKRAGQTGTTAYG